MADIRHDPATCKICRHEARNDDPTIVVAKARGGRYTAPVWNPVTRAGFAPVGRRDRAFAAVLEQLVDLDPFRVEGPPLRRSSHPRNIKGANLVAGLFTSGGRARLNEVAWMLEPLGAIHYGRLSIVVANLRNEGW